MAAEILVMKFMRRLTLLEDRQATLVQRRKDLAAVLPYLHQVKQHQGLCQAVTMHATALRCDLEPIQAELELLHEVGSPQGQADGADFNRKVAHAATASYCSLLSKLQTVSQLTSFLMCISPTQPGLGACPRAKLTSKRCLSIDANAQTGLGLLCLAGQGLPSSALLIKSRCPHIC
ncbi:hypothetical protein ABBQ38_012099 [Trebouxia sp. C0009 RCD-2024]